MVLFLHPGSLFGQDAAGGSFSFQTNLYPKLRINTLNITNSKTYTLSLKGYNLDKSPLEYGMHITFGYDPSIAFSYGASFAYLTEPVKYNALKAGFSIDKIQMNDFFINYISEYEDPDDAHESLNLYLEWEVFPHRALSFFMNGNYRFVRSEILLRSKLVDEQVHPDGSTTQTFNKQYGDIFYLAGFHFGFGIQIHF